jgi:hypothetical protein
MPTWRVKGADRATGQDKEITVAKDTEREAELAANSQNMVIESIEVAWMPPPTATLPRELDLESGAKIDRPV